MAHVLLAQGDARHMPLRDKSVHCCVTSPPFYGLRDYQTGRWEGGSPACDHSPASTPQKRGLASSSLDGGKATTGHQREGYRTTCGHCGAQREDHQLGLEETVDDYVANLVQVFREVKRVLRDDGTCWLNLGDSFARSSIRTDLGYCLEGLIEGQPLLFGNATTIGITSQCRDIALHNNGFPYGIFLSLLGIERITIKQRDNDFCQVLHTLTSPSYCWIGIPLQLMSRHAAHLEIVLDAKHRAGIIIANHKADSHPIFRVLRSPSAGTCEKRNTSFSIEKSAKPITEIIRDGETIGNPITFNTPLKCFPDIYLVDKAIPFRERFDSCSSHRANFRVTKASKQQLSLMLDNSGWDVTAIDVGHLYTPNTFGSLVRYQELYDKALRKSNTLRSKQELGIPDLVKRALMEDGWICRSTIIWQKPSCMPESVQDRPTRSHEQVFLFSKAPRYFYDGLPLRQPMAAPGRRQTVYGQEGRGILGRKDNGHGGLLQHRGHQDLGSNIRSVWTIPSEPFSGAHFATFPTELVRRCILAGTSAHGVCNACGNPWTRIVERQRLLDGQILVSGAFGKPDEPFRIPPNGVGHFRYSTRTTEYGWQPSCHCNAGVTPAIVLDPFVGSSTTVKVARELGRHGVGLDLSWNYVHNIARERLGLADLARWNGTSTAPAPDTYTDLPLFTLT